MGRGIWSEKIGATSQPDVFNEYLNGQLYYIYLFNSASDRDRWILEKSLNPTTFSQCISSASFLNSVSTESYINRVSTIRFYRVIFEFIVYWNIYQLTFNWNVQLGIYSNFITNTSKSIFPELYIHRILPQFHCHRTSSSPMLLTFFHIHVSSMGSLLYWKKVHSKTWLNSTHLYPRTRSRESLANPLFQVHMDAQVGTAPVCSIKYRRHVVLLWKWVYPVLAV